MAKRKQNNCGQKNTCDSINIDLHKSVWSNMTVGDVTGVDLKYETTDSIEKTFGDPQPVNVVGSCLDSGCGLKLSSQQTKLLKTVVDYLNQASITLHTSNNRFLSSAAKDLANQVSNQFCVG